MANAPPSSAVETGLKVLAVNVPANDDNERRTRDGKWTLRQLRQSDAIVPLQSGTNAFDSQRGKTGFGMPRNTQTKVELYDDEKRWTIDQFRSRDSIVRLQSGSNQFESQKGMTGFGTPRDVKGKHLKRIWELEFPEEAVDNQAPVNVQQPQQVQQPQTQMYNQQAPAYNQQQAYNQQAYNQQRPGFNAQRPAINGQ
ncbi:hypothetical protein WR25_08021 [Diploscapter pachys]|uniref:Calponin-homology (CH) domain-containing protein n=1 Tax=Diploscapter pachys TaxID=2018661 RepID=A0A2A2JDI9_9BILA|nr:hypothetical protein WR25_08021 [Diploscapter pachys]